MSTATARPAIKLEANTAWYKGLVRVALLAALICSISGRLPVASTACSLASDRSTDVRPADNDALTTCAQVRRDAGRASHARPDPVVVAQSTLPVSHAWVVSLGSAPAVDLPRLLGRTSLGVRGPPPSA